MGSKGSKRAKEDPKPDESCFFSLENQNEQRQIYLTDATPCTLQTLFNLQLLPKVLENEEGLCIIHKDGSWLHKLEKNRHYKIIFHQHAEGKLYISY